MSQGTKQFPTRIPVALHAALAAAATENNRSLNAEVIYRLDQTFQENPDCPPVAVDLLVTAAANAVATVVTEVITTCFTKLEERILQKMAPEVFVNSFNIDTSDADVESLRAAMKATGNYGELSTLHQRLGLQRFDFTTGKRQVSPTGRLSESQPEISGLSTLPQAIRRGHTERLPLEGQTWVITGSLETMSRDKARDYLIQMGAEVAGVVVAGKTCGLLWGPGAGSKLVKAKQYGVQLMDEVGFLDLLRAMAILPPEAEDQHLTVPGALEWDRPGEETSWRVHDGLNPIGLCISADTIVEVERRDGVKLPADRAGDFNWVWDASLLPGKDPAEIYAWRLVPGQAEYPEGWIENTGSRPLNLRPDQLIETKTRPHGLTHRRLVGDIPGSWWVTASRGLPVIISWRLAR